jgi:dienelactone hydrolase
MLNRSASAWALAGCAWISGCASPLAADAPRAARIEVHVVQTLTLTPAQFFAGDPSGAAETTIAGELRLPASDAQKLPAVVMLHGDAGAVGNQVKWIDELNALGIAVFTLDSFSARGAIATGPSLATMPSSISGLRRVVDAERALAVLARHPRIDPTRIAVMGVSSGGRTALVAAQSRFATGFGTPGLRFAAYIALYPPCNVRLRGDEQFEPGAQRIFIGAADVLTSADACRRYAERLRAAGADIAATVYPLAHHGFDNALQPVLIRVPEATSDARCDFAEATGAAIVNIATGLPPTDADACVTRGFVAGYDANADAAVRKDVARFLIERFGPRR